MSDICQEHGLAVHSVLRVCKERGVAPPAEGKIPPGDMPSLLHLLTWGEVREMAQIYGVRDKRVLDVLTGDHSGLPLELSGRRDLHPSAVSAAYVGEDIGVHPVIHRAIRAGELRTDVTKATHRLAQHPGLRLRVLDTLHLNGAMGRLAAPDELWRISRVCGVSYTDVWEVAQLLSHRPTDTAAWGGERWPTLSEPTTFPTSLGLPWGRLEEHERIGLRELHSKWEERTFWVPVEEWYRLGLHGIRDSLRYPAPKDLPGISESRIIPGLGGRRADSLGRIRSRTGRFVKRRYGSVRVDATMLPVDRLVYEAWTGIRPLPDDELVHINGEKRDCRPENLRLVVRKDRGTGLVGHEDF